MTFFSVCPICHKSRTHPNHTAKCSAEMKRRFETGELPNEKAPAVNWDELPSPTYWKHGKKVVL